MNGPGVLPLVLGRTTDSLGRYVEMRDAQNGRTRFWYEANGNVAAIEGAKGVVTRAAYNSLGQRTRCGRARHFQPVCTRIRLAICTRPAVTVRFATRRSTAADLNQPQV